MTAMNVVHMRVKPGKEEDFVRIHRELEARNMPGMKNFWLIRSGERSFVVVGEWESQEAMVAARPSMVANLDKLRPILEDLGGGRTRLHAQSLVDSFEGRDAWLASGMEVGVSEGYAKLDALLGAGVRS